MTSYGSCAFTFVVYPYATSFVFSSYNPGSCFKRKLFYNVLNESQSTWSPAGATWYGSANGAGSNACLELPVIVIITDECPGCVSGAVHFDLSGTAFGAMALPGQADQLRNAGVLEIQYQRAKCSYPDKKITFQVDAGSNPYYVAAFIKYVDGDGVLGSVELKQAGDSDSWLPLQQ
ncbi:hypothetical protein FEM48_Zijuj08G0057200 [Ziziphus jujuba var. spinosa]|uniref:Expansin-like EG45 domain-containing protein n=1 Tax=Ziziphus jujuba var. spinosa TaxID=714518 RepID=A0A978UXB1_ZIZJJ|nr:hypothetical protein FEM48_Zijuj08G0057200 [Ziziphus jujuba var. spinosa]